MSCHEVEFALNREPTPDGVRQHLAECERCRRLAGVLKSAPGEALLAPEVLEGLQRKLATGLVPVSPLAPASVHFFALAAIFLGLFALGSHQLGMLAIPVMSPMQIWAIFCTLFASAGSLALSLVWQMVPGSRFWAPPALLPVGVLSALVVLFSCLFPFQREQYFVRSGLVCLKAGLAVAAPASVVFWLVLRRGAMLNPSLTGATAGLLSGLVGMAVLETHCPNFDLWHILAWHLGTAAAGAIIGWAIGRAGETITAHRPE